MFKNTQKRHKTFVDRFIATVENKPDAIVYQTLADDGATSGTLTFRKLDQQSRVLGRHLDGLHGRGERALLLYSTGLDYITAFFGCLYSGVIAVPAYPPRMNRNLSRVLSIIEDCSPRFVLTTAEILASIPASLIQHPALRTVQWIATDDTEFGENTEWNPTSLVPDSLAFLQYTSGSTSAPKGVMVSHENLLRNEDLISKAFGVNEASVIVSWLPIYHDMGLIGNVLAAAYNGASCHLLSPAAFLRRPAIWLEAVSRLGGTASGGPNFAYDLCVQKIRPEECQHLDLSRWQVAFNGAEPVRASTLERFTEKFRPFGFRHEAFFPCFGMAETTLFVSGGVMDHAPVIERFQKQALSENRAIPCDGAGTGDLHVSSGRPRVDRVVIVDPVSGLECPEGLVGEIWVSDGSVARGYWRKPELSATTFGAVLTATGEGPFLRTGDLGVVRNGELFVMGRLKDLIIIRGRNHYPQDIELTAEASHSALRPGCTVAFSLDDTGNERVVLVAEVVRERRSTVSIDEIGQAVLSAVATEHGMTISELVLIRPATALKTSSGKLQRSATRRAYLDDELQVVDVWRNRADAVTANSSRANSVPLSRSAVESWLEGEICARLRISPARFERHRPIAEYGLDSLTGVELLAAIEEKLGIEVPFESLFVGEPSLAHVAEMIRAQLDRGTHAAVDAERQRIVSPDVYTSVSAVEIRP